MNALIYLTDKNMYVSVEPTGQQAEIDELRLELARQWLEAHADHCGAATPPWPHLGECQWPLPQALRRMPPNAVYLLLLQASGVSVGLRLQSPGC